MKKIIEKDKKVRSKIKQFEKKNLVLKIIRNNINFPLLTRFNASNFLINIEKKESKTSISNRCVATINKKKFGKLTNYSRIFFLKLAKTKKIYGLTKTSW